MSDRDYSYFSKEHLKIHLDPILFLSGEETLEHANVSSGLRFSQRQN